MLSTIYKYDFCLYCESNIIQPLNTIAELTKIRTKEAARDLESECPDPAERLRPEETLRPDFLSTYSLVIGHFWGSKLISCSSATLSKFFIDSSFALINAPM